MILRQPIIAAQRDGQFDIVVTVTGGGLSGQAGAVRHGIAKALTYYDPSLRQVLRRGGFLTRDSRVVERKMYRKAKVRRSSLFFKRPEKKLEQQTPIGREQELTKEQKELRELAALDGEELVKALSSGEGFKEGMIKLDGFLRGRKRTE